jgi:ubiquinone biosynthesis protein COQ4
MTARVHDLVSEITSIKPLQALHSVRALLADPANTGEVFKVIDALKGASLARAVSRLAATSQGTDLLRRKPELVPLLGNRAALRAMPDESVGRAYLDFVESRDLSADGLVAASEEAPRGMEKSADECWLANRLRDIHDLQHVMCGYGSDELGELCLLAFMVAQTPNRGISFIIYMATRKFRQEAPNIAIDDCVREGRSIGVEAKWLAAVDWEQRLIEPLAGLRQELRIGPPLLYRQALNALSVTAPGA